VRVIEYTLAGSATVYRLITTITDPMVSALTVFPWVALM
jgi:hypothetical protein